MIRLFTSHLIAVIILAGFTTSPGQTSGPLDKFRNQKFPPVREKYFEQGWKERVALEFEVVNSEPVESLRAALNDDTAFHPGDRSSGIGNKARS